jgi:hypothetical protein
MDGLECQINSLELKNAVFFFLKANDRPAAFSPNPIFSQRICPWEIVSGAHRYFFAKMIFAAFPPFHVPPHQKANYVPSKNELSPFFYIFPLLSISACPQSKNALHPANNWSA